MQKEGVMSDLVLDRSQLRVLEVGQGDHLVIAPPGCGKTFLLTERIRQAHKQGMPYSDMLCLTFTNRAARSMLDRTRSHAGEEAAAEVFIGNIHSFCNRMLRENGIVSRKAGVLGDDEIVGILAQSEGVDAEEILAYKGKRKKMACRVYWQAAHFENLMHQVARGNDEELYVHPELRNYVEGYAFEAVSELYQKASRYIDKCLETEPLSKELMLRTLPERADMDRRGLRLALYYEKYKRQHDLIDFNDILLLAYDALSEDDLREHRGEVRQFKRYAWCQVDEVQDLNPMQMAIVDKLLVPRNMGRTVMFLGDEQQAIYSFMGAKLEMLHRLEERCGAAMRLTHNHRSPSYLLELCNAYAADVLHIDTSLLPSPTHYAQSRGDEMQLIAYQSIGDEYTEVAKLANRLAEQYPDETTAVIVNKNTDADTIGLHMQRLGIEHFKVSGTDLFVSREIKLLTSYFYVISNQYDLIAWSKIFRGYGICKSEAESRSFVERLSRHAMTPMDLILRPGSSYVQQFVEVYETKEIVIFDTETTGLDVHADDVVQIAAVKVRSGRIVPNSEFTVYIRTEKVVPEMLGDVVNPMIDELKNHTLFAPKDALKMFMDYASGATLLAHNAEFDMQMLRYNLLRYLPEACLTDDYWDSLHLARLLSPELGLFKLKNLLETYNLGGINSHRADDDVAATANLVEHLYRLSISKIEEQKGLLQQPEVCDYTQQLRHYMLEPLCGTLARLHDTKNLQSVGAKALLASEMERVFNVMIRQGVVTPMKEMSFVVNFVDFELVNKHKPQDLATQIVHYAYHLATMKECDLCGPGVVSDRIFVSTVHRAKGLEYDNVIIFDATDDNYPGNSVRITAADVAEATRKMYVALSRARRRLFVAYAFESYDAFGNKTSHKLSRFLLPIQTKLQHVKA